MGGVSNFMDNFVRRSIYLILIENFGYNHENTEKDFFHYSSEDGVKRKKWSNFNQLFKAI